MFTEHRTVGGVFGGLVGLVIVSVMAGVLVAVGMAPVLALGGMAATNTIMVFENLPDYLSIDDLAQKSNIYATEADGKKVLLASFYDQNRVEVPFDSISQYVKD